MNDHTTIGRRPVSVAQAATYDAGLRTYMLNIYNYMASGLVLTGIVALLASQSQAKRWQEPSLWAHSPFISISSTSS